MKTMKEIAEAAAGAVLLLALFAAFWVVTDYVHDRTEHAHGEPACAWEWCPHGPNSPTARIAAWWKGVRE